MSDMKLFLELLVKNSGFRSELNNSGSAVTRFTSGARREFDALKGSVQSVNGVLAGLGLSYGFVQNQIASARLDKGLIQVKQTAGETIEMTRDLRREFFRMGHDTGRQVEELKDGFDSLIQSGQSWRAARESTGAINIAHAVSGANEKTLAGGLTVGATAFNIDLEKPGKALEILDKMVVAGRLGNAELENLSDIFARVGVNAESAGFKYEPTLAFIEALSMVERQPERLATLADSTLRLFTNLKYMAAAQKGTGVRFFDDQGGRRDPVAVLQDIRRKYQALTTDAKRASFMQVAFGHADLDTIKGLRTLLSGDSLTRINSFTRQIENAGGTLKRDLPEALSNAVDQTGRLKVTLREAADQFAQPINEAVANGIKYLLDTKKLSGKEMIGIGAGAVAGGALLYRYGPRLAKGLLGNLGSTAVGVAEGKALEKMAGVTPVFVTNWPANLGGSAAGTAIETVAGGGAAREGAKKAAGWLGSLAMGAKIKDWWRVAGTPVARGASYLPMLASRAGFVGAAAGGGYLAGTGLNKLIDWQTRVMTGGRDDSFGEKLYDLLHPQALDAARRNVFSPGSVKNNIQIDLRIDRDGRFVAVANDLNTSVDTSVRRGSFDDAIMRPNL